jgi:hypothetical protein
MLTIFYADYILCWVSCMLSIIYTVSFMLSVIMVSIFYAECPVCRVSFTCFFYAECHYGEYLLCRVSFMLSIISLRLLC